MTSTGIAAQARLENSAGALYVGSTLRRIGWSRQIEAVLRERDEEVGEIVEASALNGLARAKHSARILTKRLELLRMDHRRS